MPDERTAVRGMLTLDDLRQRMTHGEIDTVLVGFTDHYGRLMGKRYDAEFFLESIASDGAHACDYLLTVDMEMEPVPRLPLRELGARLRRLPSRARPGTLRVASWLPTIGARAVRRRRTRRRTRPSSVAPRTILRRQIERRARARLRRLRGVRARVLPLPRRATRRARGSDYRDLEPAGWYLEDYHLLQGTREEDFHGAVRRHLSDSGVPVENSKGEWGRGQHELNVRYADSARAWPTATSSSSSA